MNLQIKYKNKYLKKYSRNLKKYKKYKINK